MGIRYEKAGNPFDTKALTEKATFDAKSCAKANCFFKQ
jgi:hypothetical protein